MTMTKEEIERELDRCKNDFEYALRTYCYVMTDDGKRKLTEDEIAKALLAKKHLDSQGWQGIVEPPARTGLTYQPRLPNHQDES